MKRGVSQKRLATLARISPTHLSLIENGKDLPSQQAAERCMAALELGQKDRKHLLQALKRDRAAPAHQERRPFFFGAALRSLLQELDMSLTELAASTKRPFPTIHAWTAGKMLPSDESLSTELIPTFKEAKASESSISTLKQTHIKDVLTRSLDLAYLNQGEKDQLLCCFFQCLG